MTSLSNKYITQQGKTLQRSKDLEKDDQIVSVVIESDEKWTCTVAYSFEIEGIGQSEEIKEFEGVTWTFLGMGTSNAAYRSEDGKWVYKEPYDRTKERFNRGDFRDHPERTVRLWNGYNTDKSARIVNCGDKFGVVEPYVSREIYRNMTLADQEAHLIDFVLTMYEKEGRIPLDVMIFGNVGDKGECIDTEELYLLRKENGEPGSPISRHAWINLNIKNIYFKFYEEFINKHKQFIKLISIIKALIYLAIFFPEVRSVSWLKDESHKGLRDKLVQASLRVFNDQETKLLEAQLSPFPNDNDLMLRHEIEKIINPSRAVSPRSEPSTKPSSPVGSATNDTTYPEEPRTPLFSVSKKPLSLPIYPVAVIALILKELKEYIKQASERILLHNKELTNQKIVRALRLVTDITQNRRSIDEITASLSRDIEWNKDIESKSKTPLFGLSKKEKTITDNEVKHSKYHQSLEKCKAFIEKEKTLEAQSAGSLMR